MSANPVLHHVNLKTTRMQEMIDWYAREGASGDDLHRRAYAGEFAPEAPLDLRLPAPDELAAPPPS